ncbi:MAG: phosphatidylserine decarboxylase family protein [Gammaproteobacteria bacterium]|nr:MAG: phosphatidylserine decarboxylase family protein [Gammaproteobacteria bacterium]
MAVNQRSTIAREGWPVLGLAVLAAVALWQYFGFAWSLPLWGVAILLAWLFRDPRREIPSVPLGVLSPADGQVESVQEVQDPYLGRPAVRIRIAMSHTGVFATRSPVEGKVMDLVHARDSGLPHGVWIRTDEGDDVVVAMYRGPMHSVPRCYIRFGDRVGQGQRCGYVMLGSRVDVYVPANSKIRVQAGDRVRAGADVIAVLVHKP